MTQRLLLQAPAGAALRPQRRPFSCAAYGLPDYGTPRYGLGRQQQKRPRQLGEDEGQPAQRRWW